MTCEYKDTKPDDGIPPAEPSVQGGLKMSIVSKKWDVENKGFLSPEQQQLRKLDTEGTGSLSAKQLAVFADQHKALLKENKRIKHGIMALVALTVLFFVGTVTASVLAIQANKDTSVDSATGVMTAKGTGSPISISINELMFPIAALAFLPSDTVSHVNRIEITSEDDSWTYHRAIASIDVKTNSRLVIMTTTGDSVVWADNGDNITSDIITSDIITFTLNDGTSWDKPAVCQRCAATSIVVTDEVLEGIEAFSRHFDLLDFPASASGGDNDGIRRLDLHNNFICKYNYGGTVTINATDERPPPTAPEAPSGLIISLGPCSSYRRSSRTIPTLEWDEPSQAITRKAATSETATNYVISRSTASQGQYEIIAVISAAETTYRDSAELFPNTYYYTVAANNSEAESNASDFVAITIITSKCIVTKRKKERIRRDRRGRRKVPPIVEPERPI
jgi:hypothetical protein